MERIDYRRPPDFRPGHEIQLIRWKPCRDGWDYDTVTAAFHYYTNTHWYVYQDGYERRYARDEWSYCAP
jgi:hypothetical protein